ncbi:hypothetical protein ACFFV7_20745 [Nonomuraea spiralis]|uniref:Uncharacterized protein n=1 Tax=Nonomuraea spiralis TaxID=46182 RepID=A0ABV5II99_9ACTN|nr:hypothetical protein [Nonomuraea spiralis]GGS98811.1 hypothetical protein GCM10010176_048530 [Nonomuraea spiralis]
MKLFAAVAALTALFLWVPSPALADPGAPTQADIDAARAAAAGAGDTVGRFFAGQGRQTSLAPVAARFDGPTVAVNDLNPDFVSGRSTQIARFAFLATQATAPDGQTASVWTTRDRRGAWVVSNIAGGSDEQTYGGQTGTVFREPQLNAWYALRDGRVVPLNAEATQSLGPAGVPVADYRRLAQQRYAAKLPGSAYARDGYAGGYGVPGPGGTPLPWVVGAVVLLGAGITIRVLRGRST